MYGFMKGMEGQGQHGQGQAGSLWSHLANWDDLLVSVPPTDASRLDLGRDWPDRFGALRSLAAQLDETPCLVNYQNRRQAMQRWCLDPEAWQELTSRQSRDQSSPFSTTAR
jgi:hypothetical protein